MTESSDLRNYCSVMTTGDPFVGPAWSMAGSGPGSRLGVGSPSSLALGTETVDPQPDRRYFVGQNPNGGSFFLDPAVGRLYREIYQAGDDVTRRYGTRIYWTMNEIHPKVASSIETLVDDALGDPIILRTAIDPPAHGEEPGPEVALAKQVLDECQESIDRLRPALDDVLRPVVESMCIEFSGAAEPVWEAVGSGRSVSYRLKKLADLPREAWEFVVDEYKNVVGYIGIGPDGTPVVLPPAKLAVMTWRPRAGDPRGRAMLRPAYADCDLTWRLLDPYYQHVKNFSDPFRIGKVKPMQRGRIPGIDPPARTGDPTPTKIGAAESMHYVLSRAGTAGFAVIGDEDSIETTFPQGSGEAYLNAFKFAGDNIVQAIIGDVRATQEAAFGSRASAEVGAGNKGLRVQSIRRLILSFVEGILRTQTEMNHGPGIAAKFTPYVLYKDQERGPTVTEWASGGWRMNDTIHQAEVDAKLGLTPREVGVEESTDNRLAQSTIAKNYADIGVPERLALQRAGWTEEELDEYDRAIAERQQREQPLLGDGAPPPPNPPTAGTPLPSGVPA